MWQVSFLGGGGLVNYGVTLEGGSPNDCALLREGGGESKIGQKLIT